jgi:hypothetical protein
MRTWLIAVAIALALPRVVAAAPLAIDDCPPVTETDPKKVTARASEHYDRGLVLYLQGDYQGAVQEYVSFMCLFPTGTDVLYNIGQSYERMLEFELAIAYYQRYVAAKPEEDAERRQVSSRIRVLENLPARIQVATSPPGATVTFVDAAGVRRARDRPRKDGFELRAGSYETVSQTIEPRIGKPYSYYFTLRPKTGRLVINAEPADARIFLDDRLVGLGRYQTDLPGGEYEIVVEASGRITESRLAEVVADRPTEVSVKLPPRPKSGRTQLLIGAGVAGGVLGSVGLFALDQGAGGSSLGFFGGLGIGVLGGWIGIPHDIEVGTSSYILTAGMVGFLEAGLITGLFKSTENIEAFDTIGPVAVGGMALGAGFAVVTAPRFDLDAGDAALLNSGALWGTIGGSLFAVVFELEPKVREGLILGGLNLGLVAGALLGRQVEYSRRHVALVDLAGLAGMGIAVAAQSAIDDARMSDTTPEDTADTGGERTAHFALVGMAAGLVGGAWLTRNMDVPKVGKLAPVVKTGADGTGTDSTILGVSGTF